MNVEISPVGGGKFSFTKRGSLPPLPCNNVDVNDSLQSEP